MNNGVKYIRLIGSKQHPLDFETKMFNDSDGSRYSILVNSGSDVILGFGLGGKDNTAIELLAGFDEMSKQKLSN